MNKQAQAVIMLLFGGAVLKASLSDLYLRYVKEGLQPFLVVSDFGAAGDQPTAIASLEAATIATSESGTPPIGRWHRLRSATSAPFARLRSHPTAAGS